MIHETGENLDPRQSLLFLKTQLELSPDQLAYFTPYAISGILGRAKRAIEALAPCYSALRLVIDSAASDHKAQQEYGGYVLDDEIQQHVIEAIGRVECELDDLA